jgi:hypothetical protein
LMWCHVCENHHDMAPCRWKPPRKPPRGVNWTVFIVRGYRIPGFVVGGWNSDSVYRWGLWNGLFPLDSKWYIFLQSSHFSPWTLHQRSISSLNFRIDHFSPSTFNFGQTRPYAYMELHINMK